MLQTISEAKGAHAIEYIQVDRSFIISMVDRWYTDMCYPHPVEHDLVICAKVFQRLVSFEDIC